jgi:3,5-epimerase/4-reductase
MNIAVYGGGYLGGRIASHMGVACNISRVETRADLEQGERPDVIVNCIGKTGRPNVDWCEDHKEETYFANVTLAELFAEHARHHNIRLVHFSSGCIYEGDKDGSGFTEDDLPNFEGSFYSHTKAEAERRIAHLPHVLTIRPRMPISRLPAPRNLLNKLLSYKEIVVVKNSVTVVEDMLESLAILIAKDATGIYNMVNREPVTHQEILSLYEACTGAPLQKTYIHPEQLKVKAPRSNTILSADKLVRVGAGMPHTMESLHRVMSAYASQSSYVS